MRFFLIIFLLSLSCSQRSVENIIFTHELLKLEYPNTWERLEEKEMLFAISKHPKLKASSHEENPNLIIVAQDSIALFNDKITNYTDFLHGFKQHQLAKPNIELAEDFAVLNINETKLDVIKYKIQGEHLTFLQTQYFFSNFGQYVMITLTHEFDKPNKELSTIIGTLEVVRHEPLEQLRTQN